MHLDGTRSVKAAACGLLCLLTVAALARAADTPPITLVSLLREMADRDALARWPQPYYRCMQASSWDRAQQLGHPQAWFANADHSKNVVRVDERDGRKEWVLMEDAGPGCVTHIWIPLHRGKANQLVRIYFDGADEPAIEAKWNDLVSGKAFAKPPFAFVAAGKDDAQDAGDLYLPIPYASGCRIALDSPPFYYIINYRSYDAATAVETFTLDRFAAARDELSRVGAALAGSGNVAEGKAVQVQRTLEPEGQMALDLPAGPAAVRTVTLKLPADTSAAALRSTVLVMQCDGVPTVWCPVGEFFGCGPRLRAVEDFDRTVAADGTLTCRWVMPYRTAARLAVVNLAKKPIAATLAATVGAWTWDERSMHFHATWRREYPIPTQPRRDWNYVALQGRGVYVGDTLTVFSHAGQWYGEGDERIYIDGEVFPSHLGTGTEDYYGYAWGMTTAFSSPFLAMPRRDRAGGDWRGYTTTSRVRALDAIPFRRSLRVDMEIWHWADTQVDYAVGCFWYAQPGASSNRPPSPEQALAAMPEVPQPRVVAGAIEGESLNVLGKSADVAVERQPLVAHGGERFSGAAHLFVRPKKAGDFVEVAVPCKDGRPCRVAVHCLKSWDYGTVRFALNGKAVAKDYDFYSPTVEPTGAIDLGVATPEKGTIRLRVEVVGRNAKAKGLGTYFGLDCVVLAPSADR